MTRSRSAHSLAGAALAIALFAGTASCGTTGQAAASLPELGQVPGFALTDQRGERFVRADLDGSVWIAAFIFTRCPAVCPLMTERFGRLQSDLAPEGVRLVSITVDPEHDTPEVLARYARTAGAEPGRWTFLTGGREEIEQLAVKGFLLAASTGGATDAGDPEGESEAPDPSGPSDASAAHDPLAEITHSQRFVLVDGAGAIRGYYDSTDPEALKRLTGDARALASESESSRRPS